MKTGPRYDQEMMAVCLALATKGRGRVSPNPLVGCVVTRAGVLLGRGWHREYGGRHAEINALRNARSSVMGGTMYVNLEPCNHHGKTPPCTQAIIEAGIARVVIGSRDENRDVRGGGIRALRNAGIEVEHGVLRSTADVLNKFYFHHVQTGLPYVTVKLAQSLDGKIAARRGVRTAISSVESDTYVHGLRAAYDAVLIGSNTMRIDRPQLTVRRVAGRDPIRVVLDTHLSATYAPSFFRGPAHTIIFTSREALRGSKPRALLKQGAVVIIAPMNAGRLSLRFVLEELGRRGISSLLVEGGSTVATEMVAAHHAQELQLIVAPKLFGAGVDAFGPRVARAVSPASMETTTLGKDILITVRFKES